jgi:hypothetical protein
MSARADDPADRAARKPMVAVEPFMAARSFQDLHGTGLITCMHVLASMNDIIFCRKRKGTFFRNAAIRFVGR